MFVDILVANWGEIRENTNALRKAKYQKQKNVLNVNDYSVFANRLRINRKLNPHICKYLIKNLKRYPLNMKEIKSKIQKMKDLLIQQQRINIILQL